MFSNLRQRKFFMYQAYPISTSFYMLSSGPWTPPSPDLLALNDCMSGVSVCLTDMVPQNLHFMLLFMVCIAQCT